VVTTKSGGVIVESSLEPSTRTAASIGGVSVDVDTEDSIELFTAKVKAPAATTPAIEIVVAWEVFIGITI
jgi:hypothetical protein